MNAFVCRSLELLGGSVSEGPRGGLLVRAPSGSRAAALLEGAGEHRLSVGTVPPDPAVVPIVAGCRLLERLNRELSGYRVRHGRCRGTVDPSRSELQGLYAFFKGTVAAFSARSTWETGIVCHFKISVIGGELVEDLVRVAVPFRGSPRVLEDTWDGPPAAMRAERPPLKRSRFLDMLRRAASLAEKVAALRAEDQRRKSLEALYETLSRLKRYYGQMAVEAAAGEGGDGTPALAEYERRKAEEAAQARVRATVELAAVESRAVPVKALTWALAAGGHGRDVQAVFDCAAGRVTAAPHCEVCGGEAPSFGLSEAGALVCGGCLTCCEMCGAEVVVPQAARDCVCSTCGRPVCATHSVVCACCGERVCSEHALTCADGCRICRRCVRRCLVCGENVDWCRRHTFVNSKGEVTCRAHAVVCVGCREPHPAILTETCTYCGQTVCENCKAVCKSCGRVFCRNHMGMSVCADCAVDAMGDGL